MFSFLFANFAPECRRKIRRRPLSRPRRVVGRSDKRLEGFLIDGNVLTELRKRLNRKMSLCRARKPIAQRLL